MKPPKKRRIPRFSAPVDQLFWITEPAGDWILALLHAFDAGHIPRRSTDHEASTADATNVARLSGLKGLDRTCLSHALNTKAVARRYARKAGRRLEKKGVRPTTRDAYRR